MKKYVIALAAGTAVLQMSAAGFSAIAVEQIEAYNNTPTNTQYAPATFLGSSPTTETTGDGAQFYGQTFYADTASSLTNTLSPHANTVGQIFYGSNSVAYPFVKTIYCESSPDFLDGVLNVSKAHTTGLGALPGNFSGGAVVINNSYIAYETTNDAYLDDDRRLDYMINSADVVWVASAVTNVAGMGINQFVAWSNFNALAVSGVQNTSQSFVPSLPNNPGKQHADLSQPYSYASFAAATVSGDAAALWGVAQANNQLDALHGSVIRSILMTGADKTIYNRPAIGAIDPINGAGQANFYRSLTILTGGEKPLIPLNGTGTIATSQSGWAQGTIPASGQSVVLFQSTGNINGLTASLNWNVTSPTNSSSGTTLLDTTQVIFPNLSFEVRPVIYNPTNQSFALGDSLADPTLHSATPNDNVQYIYYTTAGGALSPGTYAFLITGDSKYPANIGVSYSLNAASATTWNNASGGNWWSASNWNNGVANAAAAQATLQGSATASPNATISLNATVVVGQLTFNDPNGYVVAPGTSGSYVIDETYDTSNNPQISATVGNQVITAPVQVNNSLNSTVNTGASLNISGGLNGVGGLTKYGGGLLVLNNADNYGNTTIVGGTLTLGPAGSVAGNVTINPGGTLNFAANSGAGILVRNESTGILINPGGAVTLSASLVTANRQLLLWNGFALPGSSGNWTGTLDLANNDLDVPSGSLATITNQLQQGYNLAVAGGIVSSSATQLTTLGVLTNNQNGSTLFNASNLFDGIIPAPTDILVKFTYYGDANLDGKVDGSDYSLIDNAIAADQTSPAALTGWYNGDFNYDGIVNGSDYTLIDNAFNSQGAILASAVTATQIGDSPAVPEPAALAAFSCAASILLSRRRANF